MNTGKLLMALTAVAIVTGAPGCGSDQEPFTEIVLGLDAGGHVFVASQRPMTLSEQRANSERRLQVAARARAGQRALPQAATTLDTGCDDTSMWFDDQEGNVGNRVCLRDNGTNSGFWLGEWLRLNRPGFVIRSVWVGQARADLQSTWLCPWVRVEGWVGPRIEGVRLFPDPGGCRE